MGACNIPLAYLITFRCYGSWLHGDARGSIDRYHNQYDTPFIPPDERWQQYNLRALERSPVELDTAQRTAVAAAIRLTCEIRGWRLRAINVRTNHVHTVVSASSRPGLVLNAFKANATRRMRETGCWTHAYSPWSDRGSKRYLWTPRSVGRAIEYVINGQGDKLPDFYVDDEE